MTKRTIRQKRKPSVQINSLAQAGRRGRNAECEFYHLPVDGLVKLAIAALNAALKKENIEFEMTGLDITIHVAPHARNVVTGKVTLA